jgi:hypothetical protein
MNPQSQQVTVGTSEERGWAAFVPRRKVLLAAWLIADVTTRALSSWRRKPAFMDVVAAYRERIDKEVVDSVRKLLAESKKKHDQRLRKLLNGRQA